MTWDDLQGQAEIPPTSPPNSSTSRAVREWVIHNAPFDVAFLDEEFARARLPRCAEIHAGVVDTLALAREMFPGKRNNLDALCERFGIANAHRTLHGALLDAQLLAEVYLAMTRGQESLTIDIAAPAAGSRRGRCGGPARCRAAAARRCGSSRPARGARRAPRVPRRARRASRRAAACGWRWRRRRPRAGRRRVAGAPTGMPGPSTPLSQSTPHSRHRPRRARRQRRARAATVPPPPAMTAPRPPPINRELSLLAFNRRVLALAEDADVPLLERLRFLCIVGSNLDEFFEIRVAGLKEQLRAKVAAGGDDAARGARAVRELGDEARALIADQYRVLNDEVLPALAADGVRLSARTEFTAAERAWAADYFQREVRPLLTPIGLDPAHPFPQVVNKSLNFVVELSGRDAFGRDDGDRDRQGAARRCRGSSSCRRGRRAATTPSCCCPR